MAEKAEKKGLLVSAVFADATLRPVVLSKLSADDTATVAAGCQLFASAANSTAGSGLVLFATSACLISFGGTGIQISIVHLANLFPRNQFTALAILNGTIIILSQSLSSLPERGSRMIWNSGIVWLFQCACSASLGAT
mmetsp:Transcript_23858/g.52843  ORF Transcript_23858/g.52843 Transcript_23858/m.52843 type:complete len:138 (+) Transcript_23858:149-562(+)